MNKATLMKMQLLKVSYKLRYPKFLNTTNEMQRYAVFFIVVSALHVSSGFSAHHQELKNVHAESGTSQTCLVRPLEYINDARSHER